MSRIEEEKRVVSKMVEIYCRHKESNKTLCTECNALLEYAHSRLSFCPHGNAKPTCRKCPIHCYKAYMREKLGHVMRYSGPRLLLYSPLVAIKHMVRELKHR